MRRIEYRGMKYQNEGYRPCRSFMLSGGIYGRSRDYPWRAWRRRRVFSRIIRIDCTRYGETWRRRTANALALNQSDMVPVFAYEWRPRPVMPRAPRPRRILPIQSRDEPIIWKRAA